MKTFSIDNENNISVFTSQEEAAAATATPFDSFNNQQELAELAMGWPDERLVAIWNSLPGVKPTEAQRVNNRAKVIGRIWSRIQHLGEPAGIAEPQPTAAASESPATPSPRKPKGVPAKGKAAKKTTTAKAAPKAKKSVNAQAAELRKGSKMAQVIALMQRKGGVSISEVMQKMGWQRHTVRGFVAGALKKAGYPVESFKPDNGERTYRLKA